MDVHEMSLRAFAQAYREGRMTPIDVVETYLDRIARYDPALGAYVRVDHAGARSAAQVRTAELAAGRSRGPLHGVPVALKDLIDIQDTITMAGSIANRQRRSPTTATLVRKLEAAGMIVLGKLHTVEFAFGGWGLNPEFGTPRNPWDRRVHRVPGGSSSGAGVAVAAGLAPCAIGTDTGGSVRLPAAFCGVTGLKTTKGLVSCHGIVQMSPGLDTPGPIARDAADAALLLAAMQGEDPLDPSTLTARPAGAERRATLVVGRLDETDCPGVQPDVWANYEAALRDLERGGVRVRGVTLPRRLQDYLDLSVILEAEAYAVHGERAENAGIAMGAAVRARVLKGAVSARSYLQALWQLPAQQRDLLDALDGVDGFATPTTLTTAIPVAEVDDGTTPAMLTRFVNLLGLCALAVPTGFDHVGLPTSMQIVGRPFYEAAVLAIGDAYQNVSHWHEAMPPIG